MAHDAIDEFRDGQREGADLAEGVGFRRLAVLKLWHIYYTQCYA